MNEPEKVPPTSPAPTSPKLTANESRSSPMMALSLREGGGGAGDCD